jgi:TBC1 domain family protein 5
MHELLAVCLYTIDRDSLLSPTSLPEQPTSPLLDTPKSEQSVRTEAMYTTLDRRFVEHDTFELFCGIMKGAKSTYEWRAEEGPVSLRSIEVQ